MEIFTSQNLEFFARLLLAVFFGGLIGLERQMAHKTAGLRTFALVALGSALLTVISILLSQDSLSGSGFDISRIPSQIVTGIGFIGAGLIIFHGMRPKGITTAAGLWVSAAVGIATGFGFYLIAAFTTLLTILIFVIFWFFEEKIIEKWEWTEQPEEERNSSARNEK